MCRLKPPPLKPHCRYLLTLLFKGTADFESVFTYKFSSRTYSQEFGPHPQPHTLTQEYQRLANLGPHHRVLPFAEIVVKCHTNHSITGQLSLQFFYRKIKQKLLKIMVISEVGGECIFFFISNHKPLESEFINLKLVTNF